jgi:hypothetical protein
LFHAEGHGRTDERTDRQKTDTTELAVDFRDVANAPKNAYSILGGKQRLFGSLGCRSEDVQKILKERWAKRGGLGVGDFIWLGTGTSNRLL